MITPETIKELEAQARADERERILSGLKSLVPWWPAFNDAIKAIRTNTESRGAPMVQYQADAVKAAIEGLVPATYRCALCNAELVEAQLSRYGEMLLHFDGSEWCGPCIPIRKERRP